MLITYITIALASIAGIVWLVRLEGRLNEKANKDIVGVLDGRLNGHDQLFAERSMQVTAWLDAHETRDNERHLELKATLTEIKDTLKQAPRDVEAAQVLAAAKVAALDVVNAAKVVATAVTAAAELAKRPSARRRGKTP